MIESSYLISTFCSKPKAMSVTMEIGDYGLGERCSTVGLGERVNVAGKVWSRILERQFSATFRPQYR